MKVLSVVGARPQFIKAAPVSACLRESHTERLLHTGQHYEDGMSAVFFRELGMPEPDINLGIGSGTHAQQTGAMLIGIEEALLAERPDFVLVYGDTNSTLAAALAAAKLHIPVAHVEAGLRSFNRRMPEEINRVIADRVSDLLLCPSQTAVDNLTREGMRQGVRLVGDVMADALRIALDRAQTRSQVYDRLRLERGKYLLVTVHRAENTDDPSRLKAIFRALEQIDERIVFPVHPRTRKKLSELSYTASNPKLSLVEPVGYLDMVQLEAGARLILTDSGGIQKEAYWLGVPCLTLRDDTEWVETIEYGWNLLVGAQTERILQAVGHFKPPSQRPVLYGDGHAAPRCVAALEEAARR